MMRREYWHVTEALLFLHFVAFLAAFSNEGSASALALIPQLVPSQPWRLLTFQFIHGNMFWFFISMLVLWIMARAIEEDWGSPRFLVFWLISVLGAGGAAMAVGQGLAGDVFLSTSLLFTYATLYPDTEFYIFFVLPVKVKWIAFFSGGALLLSSLTYGLKLGLVNAIGMSAGYLFFLATRKLPTRRKLVFEMKKRKAAMEVAAEGSEAEQRNRGWDARVREAEARSRELGRVADEDAALLEELDAAVDSSVTVCAPEDFGYVDDPVCRGCRGYPECAARRIRMAAGAGGERPEDGST